MKNLFYYLSLLSFFLLSISGDIQSQTPTQVINIHFKDTTVVQYQLVSIDSIVNLTIVPATYLAEIPSTASHQSATCKFKMISNGGGFVHEQGICWSTKQNPTIDNAKINCGNVNYEDSTYSCEVNGLQRNTVYYFRGWSRNQAGIGYSNEVSIRTSSSPLSISFNNHEYNTFSYNGKEWFQENLTTSKYRNGDEIRYVKDSNELKDALEKKEGAWCYYNFDPNNEKNFGKLYNVYALKDNREITPLGWVAISPELFDAWNYQNNNSAAGPYKAIGTIESGDGLWKSPNTGATNQTNFWGQPGGYMSLDANGSLVIPNQGTVGKWWVFTKYPGYDNSYTMQLDYDTDDITIDINNTENGYYSIRCIK